MSDTPSNTNWLQDQDFTEEETFALLKGAMSRTPSLAAVELVPGLGIKTSHFSMPWTISEEFIQDNDRESAANLIKSMAVGQLANELADLAFNGDRHSEVPYLASLDGWLVQSPNRHRRITLWRRDVTSRDVQKVAGRLPNESAQNTTIFWHRHHAYVPKSIIFFASSEELLVRTRRKAKLRVTQEGWEAIMRAERYFVLHTYVGFGLKNPESTLVVELVPWYSVVKSWFTR